MRPLCVLTCLLPWIMVESQPFSSTLSIWASLLRLLHRASYHLSVGFFSSTHQHTAYSVQRTAHRAQRTAYSVQFTEAAAQGLVPLVCRVLLLYTPTYSVQRTACSVQRTAAQSGVQQRTAYTPHGVWRMAIQL